MPYGQPKQCAIPQFFVVKVSVQTMLVFLTANLGFVRNLMSKALYLKLPFQPPIRPISDVQIVKGSRYQLNQREIEYPQNTYTVDRPCYGINTTLFKHCRLMLLMV